MQVFAVSHDIIYFMSSGFLLSVMPIYQRGGFHAGYEPILLFVKLALPNTDAVQMFNQNCHF